jgi:tetratricopeptide (TPR) repeat protein
LTGESFKSARLDEIDEVTDGRCPFRPVRYHFGITAFGVNAWTARDAGDRIINEHVQDDEEELYVVIRGRATFEVGDEKVDAPAGTLVFVAPEARRTAFAEEAATTVLAIGGVAGEPYQADGWEIWAPVAPHYHAGDYDRVIELLRPAVEQHPQYPTLSYNLACVESLAGRTADAVGHLRQAIELSPRFRDIARDDSDLDPIRDEPQFGELVGA